MGQLWDTITLQVKNVFQVVRACRIQFSYRSLSNMTHFVHSSILLRPWIRLYILYHCDRHCRKYCQLYCCDVSALATLFTSLFSSEQLPLFVFVELLMSCLTIDPWIQPVSITPFNMEIPPSPHFHLSNWVSCLNY